MYLNSPLKWAGGKGRVLPHLVPLLNQHKDKRLVEPFMGACNVALNTQHKNLLLADSNKDLVNFFIFLKYHKDNFIKDCLKLFTKENNTEAQYLLLRREFNETLDDWRKATLFLYLNKHAFNGLCRYNKSKGHFNVSFGFYKAPNCPVEALKNMANRLAPKTVEIVHMDFKELLNKVTDNDVVYIDPPYTPISDTANFTGYTVEGFGHTDHLAYVDKLSGVSCPRVISNHDLPVVREMYMGYEFTSVEIRRSISPKGQERFPVMELLATKYL